MAVDWDQAERVKVDQAIERHPVASGRCAALARAVFHVAQPRDPETQGRQVQTPRRSAARYVVPKLPHPPLWSSHTLVETGAQAVDALTGADGCEAPAYLATHWQYPEFLEVHDVDIFAIDPDIEGET